MPFKLHFKWAFVAILAPASAACSAQVQDGANPGTGADELPTIDNAGICELPDDGWVSAPMRRLTAREYDHAVADLLGETRQLAAEFFSLDEAISGYAANVKVSAGIAETEKFASVARLVAEEASGRLPGLLDCGDGEDSQTCALNFIDRMGRLAFRRPLLDEERELLFDLYKSKASATDNAQALRLVIEAVLQLPQFLYRPVVGEETAQPGLNKLTGYELASRLSFYFWSSIPDNELLEAAEQGDLGSADGVKAQAQRLMDDPRFGRTLESFALQWLGLGAAPGKDVSSYPNFSPEVWESAKTSVTKFFSFVMNDSDARLETLFAAPVAFVDARLANIYQVSPSGGDFAQVETDASRRGGIFTQAALLSNLAGTTESSPVKRGMFVRSRLLCQSPPAPPDNGVPDLAPARPDATLRQRLEEHRENPACSGCHAFIDPLGLAFENFDGVGTYRETEHGIKIDASGELTETDVDGSFANAMELMNMLKTSRLAAECLTTQFYRFAVGRLESQADACALNRVTHAVTNDTNSLRDMFLSIATSDAFRFVGTSE